MNASLLKRAVEVSYAIFDKETHFHRCFVSTSVFYKGRLLAIQINQDKTHPINRYNLRECDDGSKIVKNRICSEVGAIIKVRNRTRIPFQRLELVNVRINRNYELSNSCPCSSCKSVLNYYQFKNIYFTDVNGQFQKY